MLDVSVCCTQYFVLWVRSTAAVNVSLTGSVIARHRGNIVLMQTEARQHLVTWSNHGGFFFSFFSQSCCFGLLVTQREKNTVCMQNGCLRKMMWLKREKKGVTGGLVRLLLLSVHVLGWYGGTRKRRHARYRFSFHSYLLLCRNFLFLLFLSVMSLNSTFSNIWFVDLTVVFSFLYV